MKKLFTALMLLVSATVFCQVGGVGISPNGSAPDPSAILDLNTPSKGFLLPRLTQTQRDSINSPAFGLMILNTTTNCFNVWLGATWRQICGDCDFATPVPGNNGPICETQTLNLTATTIQGATYHWTGPNGFSDTTQNPSITNATAGASGSYSVQATLNGCTSQPQSTVATVNAIPQTPVAGNNGPCVGQTLILTSSSIAGASYSWSGPNNFTANTQNPIIGNAQVSQSGNYNVIASISGCNSSPGTTSVVVSVIPGTPGTINTASSTICASSTSVVFSIDTVDEATTYTWSVPANASIISGQGTTSITVNFGSSSGNVSVTASNLCGTSAPSVLPVTVLASPQTFNYSGSMQTFTVPSCVTSITITAYGAQGGSQYGGNGANGGSAAGTLAVTPGQVLYVSVGGQNGYNGGGLGTNNSNGGGMSDVRTGGTSISNWVIVAGGGGGGGNNGSGTINIVTGTGGGGASCANGAGGGGGGYYTGGSGSAGGSGTCTSGGGAGGSGGGWAGGAGGGGLTSGGSGGTNNGYGGNGGDGSMGQGGNYANSSCGCGGGTSAGGGGGGYYGGGGASVGCCAGGSGGGGSSWASASMTNTSFSGGVQSGNGQVVITW